MCSTGEEVIGSTTDAESGQTQGAEAEKRTDNSKDVEQLIEGVTNQVKLSDKVELLLRTLLKEKNANVPGVKPQNVADRYVSIPTAASGNKYQNKGHHCPYCGQYCKAKCPRHIKDKHKDNQLVRLIRGLPSKDQIKNLQILVRLGDYLYNNSSESSGHELVVLRRPNLSSAKTDVEEKIEASKYVPCDHCLGYVTLNNLRHHRKECAQQSSPESRMINHLSRKLVPEAHEVASLRITDDDVKKCAIRDELIMRYANELAEYLSEAHHENQIRREIRALGLFYKTLLSSWEGEDRPPLGFFLHNKRFKLTNLALKKIAAFDEEKNRITKANPAVEMNGLIKKLGEFHSTACVEDDRIPDQEAADRWLKCLAKNSRIINRQAKMIKLREARIKKVKMPSKADIVKFVNYVEEVREQAYKAVDEEFSYNTWKELCKSTLVLIQLFNRKRQGEVSRLSIEDTDKQYITRLGDDTEDPEYQKLSEPAKEHAKQYIRVAVPGKRGLRNLGVIMHVKLLTSIELIKKTRKEAKIPDNNPHVFGRRTADPTRELHFEAYQCMRDYSKLCGAAHPETLRGTLLRKHMATWGATTRLSPAASKDLCNFMGHHQKIHDEYYAQSMPARELMTIAPMLEDAQGTERHPALETSHNQTDTESDGSYLCSLNTTTESKLSSIIVT